MNKYTYTVIASLDGSVSILHRHGSNSATATVKTTADAIRAVLTYALATKAERDYAVVYEARKDGHQRWSVTLDMSDYVERLADL